MPMRRRKTRSSTAATRLWSPPPTGAAASRAGAERGREGTVAARDRMEVLEEDESAPTLLADGANAT
jgi:hypothetical protein